VNLRKKIEGVLTRQAAKQAGAIRAALRNSLDVDALVADWERQNFTTMSKADARAWAQMNAQPRNQKALRAALLQTIATGYLLGQDSSQAFYAKAKTGRKLVKAAPTAEDIDNWLDEDYWDSWVPGNKPAALLVKPPGALSDLLDKAGVTINGLNRTTMNRLGTILGDGIERGFSGKTIGDAINKLLNDPSRALTIANTEMARAMSTASMETYNGFGVEKVEWLHADSCLCDLCIEAEGMGPQPIGTDFGDGVTEPPMHPNCICAVAPVIDEGDGSGLDLADFGDVLEAGDESDESDGSVAVGVQSRTYDTASRGEQWAMDTYQEGGYRFINGYLRGRFKESTANTGLAAFREAIGANTPKDNDIKDVVRNIDAAIQSQTPFNKLMTLYRGVGDISGTLYSNVQVGDIISDRSYLSTTLSKEIADTFKQSGYALEIQAPAGTRALSFNEYRPDNRHTKEQEYLLSRDSKLEVTAVDGRTITMRLIND
jgi:hypothetical protein